MCYAYLFLIFFFITVGAQGCASNTATGGLGASLQGVFYLFAGQSLSILVGQQPCRSGTKYPGGGGGTEATIHFNKS
jgi:hypothetical protein